MATQEVTKPIVLDETLQDTNTALGLLGKDTTLQSIVTALAGLGINTVGNLASLVTTDKTSLVGAVNELAGDISNLDTDKADKVDSAIAGNLAGLNGSGNLADSGWNGAKDTTSASGNPISISGLKANQLAVNPVITFEPIQAGSGTPSPSNIRAISGYDKIEVLSCGKNLVDGKLSGYAINANGTFASEPGYDVVYAPVVKGASYVISANSNGSMAWFTNKPTVTSQAYDSTRNIYTVGVVITAPITGWLAFRTTANDSSSQVEYNTSQSTYEAPNKTTSISESLGQTVYGGTLDLRSGKLTVTKQIIDLGSLTWSYAGNNYGVTEISNKKTNSVYIVSSYFTPTSVPFDGSQSYNLIKFVNSNQRVFVSVDGSQYGTSELVQAYVQGKYIVYELATPFTIQLAPHEISLLKDYAYMSTNGTNIALDYHNGELASLGDVSQLGETVNELGNNIKNARELFTYTFNGTTTWQTALYDISQKLKLLSRADIRRLQLQYDTDNRIFNIVKINSNSWQFSITCLDGTSYIDTFVAVLYATNLSENKFVMIRVQDNSSVTYTPLTTVTPSNGTVIKALLT